MSPEGSSFILHAGEKKVRCQTKLLGAHNIQNILLAASVCLELQLTLGQIAGASVSWSLWSTACS